MAMYKYLKILTNDNVNNIVVDFSLARGLDYYTGIIFEVMVKGKYKKIGSVAGGGRYDKLCDVPCVGFSIGIDRLVGIIKPMDKRKYNVTVQVIQINNKNNDDNNNNNNDLTYYRMGVVSKIRAVGMKASTELKDSVSLGGQIKYVLKNRIPYIIFVGQDEMNNNTITLKDMDKELEYKNISLDTYIDFCR